MAVEGRVVSALIAVHIDGRAPDRVDDHFDGRVEEHVDACSGRDYHHVSPPLDLSTQLSTATNTINTTINDTISNAHHDMSVILLS